MTSGKAMAEETHGSEEADRAEAGLAPFHQLPAQDDGGERRAKLALSAFYSLFRAGTIRSFRIYKRDGFVYTVYDP